ncbi:MAG: 2-dehydropantoate 2-reductase [Desulfurococcaceae archaeon]
MVHYNYVCIIGGGAVGSTLAYFLYRGGIAEIPVYYSSIDSIKSIYENKGITVIDNVRGVEILVPVIPRQVELVVDKCLYILNTVKAYSVPETIELMNRLAIQDTVVIMFQNGFGSLELAENALPYLKVAGGVVYFGAERASRNRVIYHGGDIVIAGCRNRTCIELLSLHHILRRGGLELRVTSDIDFYRWLKLALNAVVNPVTALTRSKNKIILEKEGLEIARLIIGEVVEVARRHGYELDPNRLLDHVIRSVKSTGNNYSSMAQDLMAGRITEIDYINGFVARELGRENSVNAIITMLVKLAEKAR